MSVGRARNLCRDRLNIWRRGDLVGDRATGIGFADVPAQSLAKFRVPHPIRSTIAAGIPSRVADFAGLPSVALERITSNTSRRRCAESYGIDGILFVRALEAPIFRGIHKIFRG
jgi:hypothetical protein